jgi:hypothetical protein
MHASAFFLDAKSPASQVTWPSLVRFSFEKGSISSDEHEQFASTASYLQAASRMCSGNEQRIGRVRQRKSDTHKRITPPLAPPTREHEHEHEPTQPSTHAKHSVSHPQKGTPVLFLFLFDGLGGGSVAENF